MTARSWWAARAMEHPLVRVWCIWARRDGQSADISPTAMTCSRYRATRVLNSWTVCKWEKQRRPCCLSVCLSACDTPDANTQLFRGFRTNRSLCQQWIPLPHSPFGYRPLLPPCSPGGPARSAPPWSERWFRRTLGAFSAHMVRNTCMHSPAPEPGPDTDKPSPGQPRVWWRFCSNREEEPCSGPDGAPAAPSASQRRGVTFSPSWRHTGRLLRLPSLQRSNTHTVKGGARIQTNPGYRTTLQNPQ